MSSSLGYGKIGYNNWSTSYVVAWAPLLAFFLLNANKIALKHLEVTIATF